MAQSASSAPNMSSEGGPTELVLITRKVEDTPPLPFLLFFGTRSSFAKLAIFFMRACAAALFLSLRAAFLLARSFILLMIACILVKIR